MDGNGDQAFNWEKSQAPLTFTSSNLGAPTDSRLHPLDGASLLSLSTMSWMTPVMWTMSRGQLDLSSLHLSPLDGADANGAWLQQLWRDEVCTAGPQKASLTRVLLRFQRDRFLLVLSINVLLMFSLFVGSGVLVFEILRHIIHLESSSFWEGLALCFGLVLVELFRVCCLTLSWSINLRTAVRLKTGFCMLGFNKILSLRNHSRASVEQMANVLSSDSNKVFGAVLLGPLVLPFPLLLIICSVYSCYILSFTALIGFFIFIIFIILQFVFVRLISRFQQRALTLTARRVLCVSELLTHIRLIKMLVWEEAFSSRVHEIRTSEKKMLERAALLQNLSATVTPLAPLIAVMCTFVVHTWLGLPIDTSTAYPVLTTFNCMRFVLAMLPAAVELQAEAAASVKRLEKLLLIENPDPFVLQQTDSRSAAVIMERATLSWTKAPHPADTDDGDDLVCKTRRTKVQPALSSISFTLRQGELLGVCGHVGSGKTSLICSLLEQMHLQQGSVCVNGSMAYASQQAWIFPGTVQDNILMGQHLDRSRYDRVISSCCLNIDLQILPNRDQTVLGEHGVNLPEGQKQRISLARAVYSNKDVYLLDDPLSAVDAHIGKHIFEECIKKELKGKSVILVTHQLQFMEFCDEVLVLKGGTVLETGTHLDLMGAGGHYAELINKHLEEQPHREEKEDQVEVNVNRGISSPAADQLTDQQSSRNSPVSWRTFQQYCQAAGGCCVSVFIFLIFTLLVANTAMGYWWLSFWLRHGHGSANVSSAGRGDLSLNPDLPSYQLWFAVMIITLLTVCLIKCFCFIKATLQASSTLHSRLLRRVTQSPMSFFDSTPSSSILSCFSRCQDEMDSLIPLHLNLLLSLCLTTLCICIINSVVFPVMLLPVFTLVTVVWLLLWMFRGNITQLQMKESTSRSACSSLCSSMAQGLSTIQAYQETHSFTEQFKRLLDENANHLLLLHHGMRWLAFLADSLCASMTLPVALLVVFVSNDVSSPAVKALALCFIILLTTNSQRMIQSLLEVEIRFISVERQLQCIKGCEVEASLQLQEDQVPEDWPQHGAITFMDYQMKYKKSSPVALNGLQLHIRAGEKIGIVGRAGSGKSSLALALFRLVEPAAGSILIDGVDITSVNLSHLRTRLSIIPRDPVVFTGTVRYNLDPFNRHSDEELWTALEKTSMKDTISGLDKKLQTELTDSGGQLSVGQRRLMCLSRALLRNSKIVLLDDATASVDAETDALIRIAVREAFRSCTVLTITRRIHTVLHADRILVCDHGQVVEFDHPDVLRQKPDSLFSELLRAANT